MTNLGKKLEKKRPYYLFLLLAFFVMSLIWFGFMIAVDFTNTHQIVKHKILEATWSLPVSFEKKDQPPKVVEKVIKPATPDQVDTPIKKYICEKFGQYDCLTAVAVAQAESGMREDAVNLNSGKSLDTGIFQVNQVHWGQAGCSLKELVDAYKNVDCAYSIFKASGWTPWVSYNNNSYLAKLP